MAVSFDQIRIVELKYLHFPKSTLRSNFQARKNIITLRIYNNVKNYHIEIPTLSLVHSRAEYLKIENSVYRKGIIWK